MSNFNLIFQSLRGLYELPAAPPQNDKFLVWSDTGTMSAITFAKLREHVLGDLLGFDPDSVVDLEQFQTADARNVQTAKDLEAVEQRVVDISSDSGAPTFRQQNEPQITGVRRNLVDWSEGPMATYSHKVGCEDAGPAHGFDNWVKVPYSEDLDTYAYHLRQVGEGGVVSLFVHREDYAPISIGTSGNFTFTGGSSPDTVIETDIPGVYRISRKAASSGSTFGIVNRRAGDAVDVYVAGYQFEGGDEPSPYQATRGPTDFDGSGLPVGSVWHRTNELDEVVETLRYNGSSWDSVDNTLKANVSDLFSGSYLDLTDRPVHAVEPTPDTIVQRSDVGAVQATALEVQASGNSNTPSLVLRNIGSGTSGITISPSSGAFHIDAFSRYGNEARNYYRNTGGVTTIVGGNVGVVQTKGLHQFEADANASSAAPYLLGLKHGSPNRQFARFTNSAGEDVFQVHADGRTTGNDAVGEKDFITKGQVDSILVDIADEYVATSGDQVDIAGDKSWTGAHTFGKAVTVDGVSIGRRGTSLRIGLDALNHPDMTSSSITAIGTYAMENHEGGAYHTAVGSNALRNSTNGNRKTALGDSAGTAGMGSDSVAIGSVSLTKSVASHNTAIGSRSAPEVTTGSGNVFVGSNTGNLVTTIGTFAITTGSANTFVGTQAGQSSEDQVSNSTILGYRATIGASDSVTLGSLSTNDRAQTVSVGSDTVKRQITNVADGVEPNDAVNILQLQQELLAVELKNGNYGDIAVTSNANVWTINPNAVSTDKIANGAVSNAKLASVPTQTFKGRISSGPGAVENLTLAQVRELLDLDARYQASSENLTSIAGLTLEADRGIYATSSNSFAVFPLSAYSRSWLGSTNEQAFKNSVGLGTLSAQNANNVNITGGVIGLDVVVTPRVLSGGTY